jgi:hypothetical protein
MGSAANVRVEFSMVKILKSTGLPVYW